MGYNLETKCVRDYKDILEDDFLDLYKLNITKEEIDNLIDAFKIRNYINYLSLFLFLDNMKKVYFWLGVCYNWCRKEDDENGKEKN